jgi:hypothetical protein
MFNNYQNLGVPLTQKEMMETKGGTVTQDSLKLRTWRCNWIDPPGFFILCHPETINPDTDSCADHCDYIGDICSNWTCA